MNGIAQVMRSSGKFCCRAAYPDKFSSIRFPGFIAMPHDFCEALCALFLSCLD
jgi:hypothetical protein